MTRDQAERIVSAFEVAVQGFGNHDAYESLRRELVDALCDSLSRRTPEVAAVKNADPAPSLATKEGQ